MPTLVSLQDDRGQPLLMILADGGSEGLWARMLSAAGIAARSSESEVALAGISTLLALLRASGSITPNSRVAPLSSSPSPEPISPSSPSNDALTGAESWLAMPEIFGGNSDTLLTTYAPTETTSLPRAETSSALKSVKGPPQGGAIALWEAVWEALSDSVCRAGSSAARSSITDSKALVLLATGLGSLRMDLWEHFTRQSSVTLLDILTSLMTGKAATAAGIERPVVVGSRHVEGQRRMTEVQRAAISVVESLSFGSDEAMWTALVARLLDIIGSRGMSQTDVLAYRLICLVQSLYLGGRLPDIVKAAMVGDAVGMLGRIMYHNFHEAVGPLSPLASPTSSIFKTGSNAEALTASPDRLATSASGKPISSTLAAKNGIGEFDELLWIVSVNALVAILHNGLRAGTPTSSLWETLRKVSHEFLYSQRRNMQNALAVSPLSLAEYTIIETYDIRIAKCLRDALSRMTGNESPIKEAEHLVDLLARGSEEGMRGRRPRFVRACQSSLFSLADARWTESGGFVRDGGNVSGIRREIADRAAGCVVRISDGVLGRFIADGNRAGKCPLPAERRAEAVYLLRRLQSLRVHADGQDSRLHLRTLNARFCECVDTTDDAVRGLARDVLDESTAGEMAAPISGAIRMSPTVTTFPV
jgi:hypothetical protein